VSDALFVAMKAGVTTIPELASALGAVLPYSQSLGVSFDETAAAVAALTKGGLTTSVATTGLRAALNSILAPSKQAKDLAKELGIEFNAAGLEAMGLEGFLAEVNRATGGSNVALQTLFGSTEATAVALGFAGAAGESFSKILVDMGRKLGATEEAMAAVDASVSKRIDDSFQAISNTLIRLALEAMPGLAAAMETAVVLLDALVAAGTAVAGVLGSMGISAKSAGISLGILAAIFAGKLAAPVIAAMVTQFMGFARVIAFVGATSGVTSTALTLLSAAVRTLRGALMTLGLPALIIGAGVLVQWFLELKEATGSWSEAFSEAGRRIKLIFDGLVATAGWFFASFVSMTISGTADVLEWFARMGDGIVEGLQSIGPRAAEAMKGVWDAVTNVDEDIKIMEGIVAAADKGFDEAEFKQLRTKLMSVAAKIAVDFNSQLEEGLQNKTPDLGPLVNNIQTELAKQTLELRHNSKRHFLGRV